jgi:hypothetical protein
MLNLYISVGHRWASIKDFSLPISEYELFSLISDHSNIRLNFDVRYLIYNLI